jgi:hypothetical protein
VPRGKKTATVHTNADASSGNPTRRLTVSYPNGRQINLGCGAADNIEDLFSLVKTVGS